MAHIKAVAGLPLLTAVITAISAAEYRAPDSRIAIIIGWMWRFMASDWDAEAVWETW